MTRRMSAIKLPRRLGAAAALAGVTVLISLERWPRWFSTNPVDEVGKPSW